MGRRSDCFKRQSRLGCTRLLKHVRTEAVANRAFVNPLVAVAVGGVAGRPPPPTGFQ